MNKPQFSKVILGAVMLVYFYGVVFASVIVSEEHAMLGEFLAYMGTPTATAIGFYAWKSKAENVLKITNDPKRLKQAFLERECDDIVTGTDDNSGDSDCSPIDCGADLPDPEPEIKSHTVARVRRIRGGKRAR